MLVQKAEFLVVNTDGTEHRIIATTAGRASDAFEVSGNRVRQVTLDHEVQNYEKDPDIVFTTTVTPDGAVAGGCKAAPSEQWQRTVGDEVIFTAYANTGWAFSGWYRNGAQLSTASEAKIAITPQSTGETALIVFEARFAPSV